MIRKIATAGLAIALLGATALTTTDALAFRPTHRVAAFKVAPKAGTVVKAAPRHAVFKTAHRSASFRTARRYASFKTAHKYTAPHSLPAPKVDPGKIGLGAIDKATNPGKSGPGFKDAAKAIHDAASIKPAPYQTPALPGDKVGKLPGSTVPGPLSTPAPGPGGKLADKIQPKKDTGTPSDPGKPGDNKWPSKNWPSGSWPSTSWPSAPDGPVVSEPSSVVVEQPSRVSVPARVVTVERPVTVIQRADAAPAPAPAPACGMPALAAGIDALMPTARLTATEFAMVKALRAAIADLAAAGNELGARELEAQAMTIFGYKKVWLRCGQGAFTWEKLPVAG
jgi:hypothetical protein